MERILIIEIVTHALDQNTVCSYLVFHRTECHYASYKVQKNNFTVLYQHWLLVFKAKLFEEFSGIHPLEITESKYKYKFAF